MILVELLDRLSELVYSNDHDLKVKYLNQLHLILTSLDQIDTDAIDHLNISLSTALKSSNAAVSTAALTILPLYFPLLLNSTSTSSRSDGHDSILSVNQHANQLKSAFVALLPLEKLADSKERVREFARESLIAAGRACLRLGITAGTKDKDPWSYLSRRIAEEGFWSKNGRAREQALYIVAALREPSLDYAPPPLRPYTTFLLSLLSDSDASVRSLSLSTTILIFSSPIVSAPARADLKKEMIKLDVNKKVQDQILAAVLGRPTSDSASVSGTSIDESASPEFASSPTLSTSRSRPLPPRATTSAQPHSSPLSSLPSAAFPTGDIQPLSNGSSSLVQPIYIASDRDLAEEFEGMKAGFEGKETEFNWIVRDKNVARIRGILQGGIRRGPYADEFLIGFKSVTDGVLKTASSLRTTVATTALSLILELSNEFGPSLDPLLDVLLSHCLSMAGQTKKIVATASQSAVTALISNSAYRLKTIQLLWTGMNDKIVLARTFVSAHIGTFIRVHGMISRGIIESGGGLEILEQCFKKGLVDANPIVKDNSRISFWLASAIWPKMTERVMTTLDATARKQLDKVDPSKATTNGTTTSVVANGGRAPRVSMKEMMAEKARISVLTSSVGPSTPKLNADLATSPRLNHATSRPSPSRVVSSPAVINSLSASTPRRSPATTSPRFGSATRRLSTSTSILSSPSDSTPQRSSSSRHPSSTEELVDAPKSAARSTEPTAARVSLLPIAEPIVDEALRHQAEQAEQAAERLLELAIDENEAEEEEQALRAIEEKKKSFFGPRIMTGTPTKSSRDVFSDSPDVRGGAVGGTKNNWWIKKTHLENEVLPVLDDSPERANEIEKLIASIQSGAIDSAGLRMLARLSKERPLIEDEDTVEEKIDESPSKTTRTGQAANSSSTFWSNKFVKIFDGVGNLLQRSSKTEERKEAALVLLKNLVAHQGPGFFGDEVRVFELLLKLREDASRTSTAAVEAIADTLCSQLEPLYGLGSLKTALTTYLAASASEAFKANSYAMGVRIIGRFFERLPREILEEEMAKVTALIKDALTNASGETRRSAITALVSAQKLVGEGKVFEVMGELAVDQKNLLAYYFARSAAAASPALITS